MDRSRPAVSKTGLGLIRGGVETKIQAIYCFGYMEGSNAPLCTLFHSVLDCANRTVGIGCCRVYLYYFGYMESMLHSANGGHCRVRVAFLIR